MAKRIITISREFGSGGRFIGEEVAKKLGIAYYDKDIIGKIAEHAVFWKAANYPQEKACLRMRLAGVTQPGNPWGILFMRHRGR